MSLRMPVINAHALACDMLVKGAAAVPAPLASQQTHSRLCSAALQHMAMDASLTAAAALAIVATAMAAKASACGSALPACRGPTQACPRVCHGVVFLKDAPHEPQSVAAPQAS